MPLQAQPPPDTGSPELIYSTYLGGTGEELEPSLALDALGQVYMTAASASPDFPIVGGHYWNYVEGDNFPQEVIFAKLGPGGALMYSSPAGAPYIDDVSRDIVVGPDGSIGITGWIDGGDDIEVMFTRFTQLDDGGFHLYNFSGEDPESAEAIALDPQGNLYVAGYSTSFWFPSQQPNMGDGGAFVMKLDPGLGILALHFLPQGAGPPTGLALDDSGNVYLTGWTLSTAQIGREQRDTYVWKLDPSGNPVWATFLGGSLAEESTSIAVDPAGNVWVAGWTDSPDFPTRNALQPSPAGGRDAFVTKLSASGSVVFSTFLGGASADEARGIVLNERGSAHLTGFTASRDFTLADPLQTCAPGTSPVCGGTEAFVATLDSAGTRLLLSTLLGGGGDDRGTDIAIGAEGDLFITGLTSSTDFPTRDAYQPALAGSSDFFIARLRTHLPPDCSAASASPARIVPANGELVPVSVTGATDPDGDPVDLMFTAIRQDEPIGGGDPDATGVGTATARVRASRYGQGDGRVYHLKFRATDPEGFSCAGEVAVCVPLNSGSPACGDGGAIVDSTSPRPRNASLLWSTFLGGSGDEVKLADVEIDASGHAWIAGTTASEDYPVLRGQLPHGYDDEYFFLDAFISRLTPNGALVRSGYGGEPFFDEFVEDVALDSNGVAWLAAWYETYEDEEVLVGRVDLAGSFGGNFRFYVGEAFDAAYAVATDRQGNVYLAGSSGSHWFPGIGRYFPETVGHYILKLAANGDFLDIFLLPRQSGPPLALAVDGAGNLYATGSEPHADPETGSDVAVLKLDPAGTLLWRATFGGGRSETATSIGVDTAGRVWVAGWSESPDFPVRGGRLHAGGRDAFLVRLTAGGALDVSTLFGGTGTDEAQDLTLDGLGRPYLAGLTSSVDFPLSGPLTGSCGAGRECGAGSDAFAAAFDLYATSNLVPTFATRLGGGSPDGAHGVAVTPAGTYLWVSGLTRSVDFQTFKPWQPALAGEGDAFVARIILSGR